MSTALTVVVTAVDSDATATLSSLTRQRLDQPWEIILVTPETTLPSDAPGQLRHVTWDGHTPPLNQGLDAATGENILVLRAGETLSTDALGHLLAAADGHNLPRLALDYENAPFVDGLLVDHPDALTGTAGLLFPAGLLAAVRLDPTLGEAAEEVLVAQALTPFRTQFATLNRLPAREGARLTCHRAVAGQRPVDATVAVIRGIAGDTARFPEERGPLTRALIAHCLAEATADTPADELETLRRAIQQAGVVDVPLPGESLQRRGLRSLLDDAPLRIPALSILSSEASRIETRRGQLSAIRLVGGRIQVAATRGTVDAALQVETRRLGAASGCEPSRVERGRAFAMRVEGRLRREAQKLSPRVRLLPRVVRDKPTADPGLADWARDSEVIALDAAAASVASLSGLTAKPAAQLDAWTIMAFAARKVVTLPQTRILRRSLGRLRRQPAGVDLPSVALFTLAGMNVALSGRTEAARDVLETMRALGLGEGPEPELLAQLIDVVDDGDITVQAESVCRRALAQAHAESPRDELRQRLVLQLSLHVLFHPDATTVNESPALFDPDRDLLAPLEASPLWRRLAPVKGFEPPALPAMAQRAPVLVVPGSYPRFSQVVLDALSEEVPTERFDLTTLEPRLRGVGPSMWTMRAGWELAEGLTSSIPHGFTEQLHGREAIFIDWADRGAVLAVAAAPRDAHITIRFHGADGLSMWQFLIDWSKVDEVIFVSEHLRRVVTRLLGDRLATTRVHVVPNSVDFDKFAQPSTAEAPRTLGMVGWAQRVKDPIWALEVLSLLRREDPTWRLRLIGADFAHNITRLVEKDYARAFRQRVLQPDVVDAVDYIDFTSDLPRHLRGVGFAVSSSLRESSPVGVMEIVAAEAVPVIRDWPVFRSVGGAGALFPEEWLAASPEAAAERILALSDREDWQVAANQARERAFDLFGPSETAQRYRDIILGRVR